MQERRRKRERERGKDTDVCVCVCVCLNLYESERGRREIVKENDKEKGTDRGK